MKPLSDEELLAAKTELDFYNHKNYWITGFKPKINGKPQRGVEFDGFYSQEEAINIIPQYNDKCLISVAINERDKGKTSKDDVKVLQTIFIDIDVKSSRKVDYISTGKDYKHAVMVAHTKVKPHLEAMGFTVGLMKMTGNGVHILIKTNLPITSKEEFEGKLTAIQNSLKQFEDEIIDIDGITKDWNRRLKLAGTINKKDTHQKVNRVCKLWYVTDKYNVEKNNKVFLELQPEKANKNKTTKNELQTTDTSRSGKEWVQVIKYLSVGLTKKQVFEKMMSSEKWSESPEQYREHTYKKAKEYFEKNKPKKKLTPLQRIKALLATGESPQKQKAIHIICEQVMKKHRFISIYGNKSDEVYFYIAGIYHNLGRKIIEEEVESIAQEQCSSFVVRECLNKIKRKVRKEREIFQKTPKKLICLKNGIYDIEEDKYIEHSPDIPFLSKLPIEYNPKSDCHKIKQWIKETVGEDQYDLIFEMVGYCLYRGNSYKKAFLLQGPKDTGKSTFISLLTKFFSLELISGVSLQKLCSDKFSVANLYGKWLNVFDDLKFTKINDIGIFKMATGDGPVSGEKKYGDEFVFFNEATLIYSCNNIPEIKDKNDDAYHRRWQIIFFHNTIEEINQNRNLLSELSTKEELQGLLNEAIKGLKRLLDNNKFSTELSTQDIKSIMLKDSSDLAKFAEAELVEETNSFLTTEQIYDSYCNYYANHRETMKHSLATERKVAREIIHYTPYMSIGRANPNIDGKIMKNKRVYRNVALKNPLPTNTTNTISEKLTPTSKTLEEYQDDNIGIVLQGDFEKKS